jgi:hypothetical protein
MKNLIALTFLILPFTIFCQEPFDNGLLDRLSGLKVEEQSYFNLGEYSIFTDKVERKFTPRRIKKLKKKYKVKKVKAELSTSNISQNNKIITKITPLESANRKITTLYFIESGESEIDIIEFYSINYRDTTEEQNFINLYLQDEIPESIFMEHPVSTVDFAGRDIELNNSCNWMNVNSIQCPHFGQMNWSLHQNLENAKKQTRVQYEITKGKGDAKLISEEDVTIIFEGKETLAKRTKYKAKIPKFLMGGSNELIIYYVSDEIRGRFVSCVLSHYTDDRITENGVPPLLAKVMELKK